MRPILRTVAVAAAGLLAAITTIAAPTAQAVPPGVDGSTPSISPVIDQNFPDPDILYVDGVYHAYATNSGGDNVQHMTSKNLRNWKPQADVLPELGSWVGACSFAPGGATDNCIWAPEVTAVEGGYALYYTARDEASGRQCIGLATSDSPYGPFVDTSDEAFICPVEQGGAIDAGTYYEDGQLYLLWKSDGNCCSMPAIIYIQEVSADGTTLTSEPVEIARNDQPWEGAVVEAPTLIKHDDTYYLFYSANDFGAGNYRTGYATSSSIMGPYTDATDPLMTTTLFGGDVIGPGGQDVLIQPDGTALIFFHGWNDTISYRMMYVSELTFSDDGTPVVAAASTRYEAEDGVVTNARVVGDGAASGGAKVGGMDFSDSSVTVEVWAERTGKQTIGIRYNNGSMDGSSRVEATDRLTVNGEDLGLVTFEHTTWGNWQTVEERVLLRKGWNTITLTRDSYFAEIDYIDVYPTKPDPVLELTPTGPADQVNADATRYEAEDGVVTNARVRPAGDGSGGEVVGGLDFSDSSVAVEVYAETAGDYTLGIRFANGSERGGYLLDASHFVTVNGEDAGVVIYPHTRWGNWQTIESEVQLEEGWNTVALTRRSFYAEIDYIDVWAS